MADYIQGLEDMLLIIKSIFEMTVGERIKWFGCKTVDGIIDRFDFAQIRELYKAYETGCGLTPTPLP